MTDANTEKQANTVQHDASLSKDNRPSEFVIGLVIFIIFLIFMTIWMFIQTAG